MKQISLDELMEKTLKYIKESNIKFPYKCKNDVVFNNPMKYTLTTQYGIVFTTNGMLDKNKYYFVLHHSSYAIACTFGDTYINCDKLTKQLLEEFSKKIVNTNKIIAKRLLNV